MTAQLKEYPLPYCTIRYGWLQVVVHGTGRYRAGTVQHCTAKHDTGAYRYRTVRSFLMVNRINK